MIPALALTVAALLAVAGVSHLRRPRALTAQLRGHGVVREALLAPMAVVLIGAELVLPLAIAVGLGGPVALLRASSLVAAALCLAFAGYLHVVARRHPSGIPCGCGLGEASAGPWTVLRSLLLAGFAVLTAVAPTAVPGLSGIEIVTNALAALALSIVLAGLPTARSHPAPIGAVS